jgi:hypothetical protein
VVIAYVPHPLVRMLLNQQFREGRWENWLAKLQEYDMEIKLPKGYQRTRTVQN